MSVNNLFKVADKLEKKYLVSKGQMQEGFDVGLDDTSKVVNSFRLMTDLVVMVQQYKDKIKSIPVAEMPASNMITGYNVVRTMMQKCWNPSIQSYVLENPQIVNIKRFLGALLQDVDQLTPVLKSIIPDQSAKLDSYRNALTSNITQIRAS